MSKAVNMAVAVLRNVVKCQQVASSHSEEHIVNADVACGQTPLEKSQSVLISFLTSSEVIH